MKNLILVSLLALLAGCAPTASGLAAVDRGSFTNREYRNQAFGFSLTFPQVWQVPESGEMDRTEMEEFDAVLDRFMSVYEEENGLRASEGPIYFGLSSAILPIAESYPAYLTVYAVDLSKLRGVDGAEGYLRHFAGRFPKVEAVQIGEIISGDFSDRRFYAISTNAAGVRRMEYATLVGKYALVFSIVYETAEQLTEVQRLLHAIRFRNG